MSFSVFARIWLGLVLLLSTTASAPFGSMEQVDHTVAGAGANARSVPIPRLQADLKFLSLELLNTRGDSTPEPPSHATFRDCAASDGGSLIPLHYQPSVSSGLPRLISRLTYHATAPPTGVAHSRTI
jgi:hypothetical protein